MSVPVTIGGSVYQIPEVKEENWGGTVTAVLTQLASLTFQRDTSSFTLQAEPNFGASYGIRALYLKAQSGTVASSGLVRAANNTPAVGWMNASGTASLELTASANNLLQFAGRDLLPSVDVRYFGAVGDNFTPNTTAIQNAINYAVSSGTRTVVVPEGTYISGALTVTSSIRFIGPGTIKHTAATDGNLLAISGTSTVVVLENITFDGNESAQTTYPENKTVYMTSVGTASAPAALICQGSTFKNGCQADISVFTDNTRSTNEHVMITNCRFLGGREGTTEDYDPRAIDIRSPVNYVISSNLLDRITAPATFGRAGIVIYDGHSVTVGARGSITGNTLVMMGRSQANSTLGAIDIYSRGFTCSVAGNSLVQPYGRGIAIKSDMKVCSITGNTIEGLNGGSDGTMNAQIVCNASVNSTVNGVITISGNSMADSLWDALSITGSNIAVSGYSKSFTVTSNTISNPLTTRRCIGLVRVDDANVSGNNLQGGQHAVYIDDAQTVVRVADNLCRDQSGSAILGTSANDGADLQIVTNTIHDAAGRGIIVQGGANVQIAGNGIFDSTQAAIEVSGTTGIARVADNISNSATPFTNGGSNTALFVGKNQFSTAPTLAAHEVTIATGAVTAFMEFHYVDTEGDAASDDLETINGGYDGQILTISPANSARTVVVKDNTGNIKLNGTADYSMGHTAATLTLIYIGHSSTWREIGRGDNDA